MTWADAESVFEDITQATSDDDQLAQLKRDVPLYAVRYARLRTDWRLTDMETRRAMDANRRSAHNTLIDACNILSRACGNRGRSNEWRRKLGEDRKEIGDFACHLHAILGILAR